MAAPSTLMSAAIAVVAAILTMAHIQYAAASEAMGGTSDGHTSGRKMPFPWRYRGFERFPASFFGADIHGVESPEQMEFVARHQLSGWGWQQGCMTSCCSGSCNCETSNPVGCPNVPPDGFTPSGGHEDEEVELLKQAAAFKSYVTAHPSTAVTDGIFVYRQVTNAAWWWRKNYDAYTDPSRRGYFLRSARSDELCWSSGPIWDFRNASARAYFVEQVIGEITSNESNAVNMIFFDGGLGYLASDPHRSPSGLIGGSNCSIAFREANSTGSGGRDLNFTDAERVDAVRAQITLLAEAGAALNAHGIVPLFSIEAPFDPKIAEARGFPGKISTGSVITEEDVVTALANVTFARYYEWFQSSGWSESIGMSVDNVMAEVARGIPVVGHAYGKADNCSDPQDKGIGSAVAAFLIAMGEHSYFQTSSSIVGGDPWTDSGWCWHPLYDLRCGLPKATAVKNASGVWHRSFDNCSVSLNQRTNEYSISQGGVLMSGTLMK